MKTLILSVILFASTPVFLVTSHAKSHAKWYRYYKDGVPQTSHTLTKEHQKHGYEELDSGFRVIKKVPAYNFAAAEEKKQADEAQDAENEKKRLLVKRYGSAQRAVRKRSDLISSINSQRVFSQQRVIATEDELKKELDKAASLEKNGQTVSKALQENIEKKKAAVTAAKLGLTDMIKQQYQELDVLTEDIRKLRRYEREVSGH